MFGIMSQDGSMVLCRLGYNIYVLKNWNRNGIPVMIKSSFAIDQLMQEYMVAANNYNVRVFKFTVEQEEEILIRKLKGH